MFHHSLLTIAAQDLLPVAMAQRFTLLQSSPNCDPILERLSDV